MKQKLITLIIYVAVSLSPCSMQTEISKVAMRVSPSPEVITNAPITPTSTQIATYEPSKASLDDIPAYNGAAYVTLNNNVTGFTKAEMTTEAFETYSPLDGLRFMSSVNKIDVFLFLFLS